MEYITNYLVDGASIDRVGRYEKGYSIRRLPARRDFLFTLSFTEGLARQNFGDGGPGEGISFLSTYVDRRRQAWRQACKSN